MKRVLSVVLAVSALFVLLASAAFAAEVELADIDRPVDSAAKLYPQSSDAGYEAASETVTEDAVWPTLLRLEGI